MISALLTTWSACGDDSGGGNNPVCGNDTVEEEEACDGVDLDGETCASLGLEGGDLSCNQDCTFNTSACTGQAQCGNGTREHPEECDGADLNEETCDGLGYGGGTLGCNPDCTFNTTSCEAPPNCGDDTVQPPEDCDGNDLNGRSCEALGYAGGILACSANCTFDTDDCVEPADCGNNTQEPGEACDGSDLAGQTCETLGQGTGTLACTASCTFDTSGCSGPSGITVVSPNGGEVLTVAATHDIAWTSTGIGNTVDIYYSLDNGASWLLVAAAETNDGTYTWTVPNTPSTECLIRVREPDGAPSDTSDGVFEIAPASTASVWYVDATASGNADGTSWADAFVQIQPAMAAAAAGDEIWVAASTYTRQGADPTVLALKADVAVWGGFAGTETDRNARDPIANPTVLDGEGNVLHVVTGNSGAILSGFNITGGNADGGSPDDSGGGMLNNSVSGLVVHDCVFDANSAAHQGGGMANVDATVTVADCVFENNAAGSGGGGMSNQNADTYITQSHFISNSETGGGFAGGLTTAAGTPIVENCTFTGNTGYNGGALYADSGGLSLINSVFYDNYAEVYGGVMLTGGADVSIINCTMTENVGNMYGGALSSFGGHFSIVNSILWDNTAPLGAEIHAGATTATVSYSNIDQTGGYIDGGGNFSANPNFMDPANGDYAIGQGSSCIDAGDGDAAPATDFLGQSRSNDTLIPNTGAGSPSYTDVGAFEYTQNSKLMLTSPNGGESWTVDATETISWLFDSISDVKLEVSHDDGATWSTIVASMPASNGSYDWTVTGPGSSRCWIKISDAADTDVWDLSDARFWTLSNHVWYVDASATGAGDGTSWTDAFTDIQSAATAVSFGDEVWVAAGTYLRQGSDPFVLTMAEGVAYYGGFPAGGSLWADRDPVSFTTTLDGEDVAEHVVIGAEYTTLDGFTVTGGNAAGGWPDGSRGGGMLIQHVSPTVSHCVFTGNSADTNGGAIAIIGEMAAPLIDECTFDTNTAGNDGGCIDFTQSAAPQITNSTFTGCSGDSFGGAITGHGSAHPFPRVTISGCTFDGNSGGWGGGVSLTNVDASSTITNCVFENNTATSAYGGGLYLSNTSATVTNTRFLSNTALDANSGRGGAVSQYGDSDSTFISCVFYANQAGGNGLGGGGLFNADDTSATVTNCTFHANATTGGANAGGAIYHTDGTLTITNTILWGNNAPSDPEIHVAGTGVSTVSYSDVEGGTAGTNGNIAADPQFVGSGDLTLQAGSPCIDAADGDAAPANDIIGNPRVDDPSVTDSGTGGVLYTDMGAYEYQP
jgi:hypothetical protein